jgi:hypothetical protein
MKPSTTNGQRARNDCLDAALGYAARGWAVLPVRAGSKVPLTSNGIKDASRDENVLSVWWARWPEAGVAIACGSVSGSLIVLDCDTAEFFWALEKSYGPLPETLTVATGRGSHRYFISPEPIRTQTLAPHLDIRAEGAYVLAPPSVHPSGARYRVINDSEPAPLPDALLKLLRAPHRLDWNRASAAEKIPEGQRNCHLTSLAGSMRRRGMSGEAIEAALLAENVQRCEPPLPESEVRKIAASVARYKPADKTPRGQRSPLLSSEGLTPGAAAQSFLAHDETPLCKRIREIVLDKDVTPYDKRREIAKLIEEELCTIGELLRTSDSRGFFFHHPERRLYDVEQSEFQRLLVEISGLSATENLFKFSLDIIQTKALRTSRAVEVHSFSFFDGPSNLLAVSDSGPGFWRLDGKEWRLCRNGDDGIFFLSDSDGTPYEPEFQGAEDSRNWWVQNFLFAHDELSLDDSRVLLLVWLCQQFFPPMRQTRIIPCFLGGQGSGKTSAMRLIGRLLIGPKFDVTGVQRDREDGFVAAISNRSVLALDNVDSKIPWLPDALALYATGQRYRLRKLYTTNQEVSYSPRAILLLSSRDPRFNRPDVTERLLPLNFVRPESYVTENEIFSQLDKRRGQIMASLLNFAAESADAIANVPPKPIAFRMADFASFGNRLFAHRGVPDAFLVVLRRLEKRQANFAADGDGLIWVLNDFLAHSTGDVEIPVTELFTECSKIAEREGAVFPRTVQGFGQRLSSMRRVIELELGAKVTEVRGHERRRIVKFSRKVEVL